MNPAVSHLLYRRQSNRAIEEYVEDFCGLCHLTGFNNVVLNDMFRVGLNEPIRSRLPEGKIHWSLEKYIDHALLLSGSSYTGSCKGGTQQSSSICQARVCPCHGRHTWVSSQDGCHARVPGQNSRHARVLPSHGCRQDFPKGFFLGGYSTQAPADAELGPRLKGLIASMMDLPLMTVRAAGIPVTSALSSPAILDGPTTLCCPFCNGGGHFVRVGFTLHSWGLSCPRVCSWGLSCPWVCSRASRGGGFHCRTSQCGGAHSWTPSLPCHSHGGCSWTLGLSCHGHWGPCSSCSAMAPCSACSGIAHCSRPVFAPQSKF